MNGRNYYRCSTEGCLDKKRVEREREDSRYAITTYEGITVMFPPRQNHEQAPGSPPQILSEGTW